MKKIIIKVVLDTNEDEMQSDKVKDQKKLTDLEPTTNEETDTTQDIKPEKNDKIDSKPIQMTLYF